ncbi:hypothetical protein [Streptomyces sp. NPDC006784]|uniref:hypothetical protein n=1 Tax=Streptomyces sp. NPDC006784 TaxID=3364764 RepID=UPI0036970819
MSVLLPRRVAVAVAAVVFLGVTGCSDQGRQYAVPHEICGIRIPHNVVEPLLPDGEQLHQARRALTDGSAFACQVNVVNGAIAVDVVITELDKPLTADDKRVSLKSLKHAKSVHIPGAHWTVQGDNKIHLSTPCGTDWADSLSFRFTFSQGEKGTEVTRRNTLRFAKAFVPGEKKKEEVCTAK